MEKQLGEREGNFKTVKWMQELGWHLGEEVGGATVKNKAKTPLK